MNKERMEVDMVEKAHQATHKFRQPSWAAHCLAMDLNLDDVSQEEVTKRPTVKVRTPAYDFRPTPIAVTPLRVPNINEIDEP